MGSNKKLIGQLIEEEVRRQQIPIVEFAEKIMCGRKNVYKIFEKSSIHIDQLKRISDVLGRNFFWDLANNPSLIDVDSEEAIQEIENRRADQQFREVISAVLRKLDKQPIIAFGKPKELENEIDIPDYMLTDYFITFTLGGFISERPLIASNPMFEIKAYESSEGVKVYSLINTLFGSRMIDVKLDYKTEAEWERTLRFVFETFFK